MWNGKFSGKIVGSIFKTKGKEYYTTSLATSEKSKRYYMHHLAWIYKYGYIPKEVDHLDGNGLNNSIANLSEKSHCENLKNQKMRSTNTSGVNGVSYDKTRDKWIVQIWNEGNKVFSKRYSSFDEAVKKREELNIEYNYSNRHGRRKY